MRGQSVHAHLGTGRLVDHNCFSNVDVTVGRGTLTMAYEWWEPGEFSVQADIANGNAIAFFPSDAVFHLIAETGDGRIASDLAPEGKRLAVPAAKIARAGDGVSDLGGKSCRKDGTTKIGEPNP